MREKRKKEKDKIYKHVIIVWEEGKGVKLYTWSFYSFFLIAPNIHMHYFVVNGGEKALFIK